MTRILLVGVGPMPRAGLKKVHATGLRLKVFLEALLRLDCSVAIGEFSFAGRGNSFAPLAHERIRDHRPLALDRTIATGELQQLIDSFKPDAIVALTDIGALCACATTYDGPIHVDYFGHPMAERQQQGAAHKNDTALAEQWLNVLPVLLRVDRFSVCSRDQRQALIGELGTAGRLNQFTSEYDFAEIVPPVLPFDEPLALTRPDALTARGIPADTRIVLCSGGYNTWVDEATLFRGLELALERDPRLHFVSTGGAIDGHVENVYTRFEQRVAASPLRGRMHLLGWVDEVDFENILLLSHVGVNCDFRTYEGELGCRNRLYGWLWAGMRAVTTVSSEPTRILADQGWVAEVPFGDATALADAILREAARGRESDLTQRQQTLKQQWGGGQFFRAFSEWARSPQCAPDRKSGVVENPLTKLQRAFLKQSDDAETVRTARELADRLSGSRAVQAYGKLNPEIMALIQKLRNQSGS